MQTTANLSEAARLLRARKPAQALPILEALIAVSKTVGPAHTLCLEALLALGERKKAIAALDTSLTARAESADAYDGLAFFARQLDRHELSNRLYREAVRRAPNDAQFWYNLATSERSLGRLTDAAAACEKALGLDPELKPALLLRSEVSRASAAHNNVSDLRARIDRISDEQATMPLWYALGKELHELGRYDEAFSAFARGAAARRRTLQYDIAQDEYKLRRIAEVFSTAAPVAPGSQIGRHIFIIGLPRSGTTLVERILGGLPNVRSNNETNNFSSALLRCAPLIPGEVFERAARADYAAVAHEYEALAVTDNFQGSVIEKLPFNYLYVAPILRTFPTAPIVWVRRNPMDACFAMFRTLFAGAYPFSYDFDELARYYAAYEKLMLHWTRLFADRITQVDYEELVGAPDAVSPRLAVRCGLSWTKDALDLPRNKSASLTASASQVRAEIYTTSSRIWRNYRRHLQPLAERLIARGVQVDLG